MQGQAGKRSRRTGRVGLARSPGFEAPVEAFAAIPLVSERISHHHRSGRPSLPVIRTSPTFPTRQSSGRPGKILRAGISSAPTSSLRADRRRPGSRSGSHTDPCSTRSAPPLRGWCSRGSFPGPCIRPRTCPRTRVRPHRTGPCGDHRRGRGQPRGPVRRRGDHRADDVRAPEEAEAAGAERHRDHHARRPAHPPQSPGRARHRSPGRARHRSPGRARHRPPGPARLCHEAVRTSSGRGRRTGARSPWPTTWIRLGDRRPASGPQDNANEARHDHRRTSRPGIRSDRPVCGPGRPSGSTPVRDRELPAADGLPAERPRALHVSAADPEVLDRDQQYDHAGCFRPPRRGPRTAHRGGVQHPRPPPPFASPTTPTP